MDLAVIIVSWNVRQLLDACLASVCQSLQHSETDHQRTTEIWVVDNGSTDESADMVRTQYPSVRLIVNDDNKGFAAANNQAIDGALRSSSPSFFLFLNPDTVVRGQALETMVGFMVSAPQSGMVGARLIFGDGSFQHSAFSFPRIAQLVLDLFPVPNRLYESRLNGRYPRSYYDPTERSFPIDHPLGAAMMVRREVIEQVGPFDEGYFMYCEEIDWALRIRRAGWEIHCVPAAEIVHYGGQSSDQIKAASFVNLWRSRFRLYTTHYSPVMQHLAAAIVKRAMDYRQKREESPELQSAYRQVAEIWNSL